ncbi:MULTISPECIES: IS110 family transposase [unclassified Paraburkholderia]|uniref:IS110 family transposase n=1 Tax=unclassified Paraburkholderia TaxID=2615204 RepID=UPI001F542361|nr:MULTISPECIES: IS110 family transposase [unclassified Paraburkholderia]
MGLAPTPYASCTSEVEQGISKAGNKRARWLMAELAWSWLRFRPASQLSLSFNQRFAGGWQALATYRDFQCPIDVCRIHRLHPLA